MTRPMTFRRADRMDKKGLEVCVEDHGGHVGKAWM